MSVKAMRVTIEALRCFRGRESVVEAGIVTIKALRCFRGRGRLEEVPENVN